MTRTKLAFVGFVAARNCMRQQVLDDAKSLPSCGSSQSARTCDSSYAPNNAQYYSVLPSTMKYFSPIQITTKVLFQYYKALLQYNKVLQSTTPVLLYTTKYTTPLLLCTTKYYSITTLYYKVLQRSTPVLQSTTPLLLCTTKYTTPVLLQYYSVLQSMLQFYKVLQSTTTYYSSTTLMIEVLRKLNCYLTELSLYWIVTLKFWTVTWLSFCFIELLLYRAFNWLSCHFTELLLDWAVTLLNRYFTELLWTVPWLSCYFTEFLAFVNLRHSEVSHLNFLWQLPSIANKITIRWLPWFAGIPTIVCTCAANSLNIFGWCVAHLLATVVGLAPAGRLGLAVPREPSAWGWYEEGQLRCGSQTGGRRVCWTVMTPQKYVSLVRGSSESEFAVCLTYPHSCSNSMSLRGSILYPFHPFFGVLAR